MALSVDQDQRLCRLMRQAQDGDKAAYEALLRELCAILTGYVHRRLGATAAAEDVIQDILVSIHSARHTYRQDKPFAPWFFAIARYRLADYWRRVFRMMEESSDEGADHAADEDNHLSDGLKERLWTALSRLPERQRRVVSLLKLEGRSIREAAKELKMTESALKVTAHRGYRALREQFESENEYQ